jgi:eukaryotic-like serine/threonine-protein kinase
MDPGRWERANEIFQLAITRPQSERPAVVARACGADDELRGLVERLVRAHERAGSFLEGPAPLNARRLVSSSHDPFSSQPTLSSYQAGQLFQGTVRFAILRRLGSGGMGVVYEAIDRTRDEIVALKTLHHARPGEIYRLKREFRSLADIAHPNLVTLSELMVDETSCFFTMELVEGVNFVDYVRGTAGRLAASQADRIRPILDQLVGGIAELHRRGKVHRDIKPSNILVTAGGRVVILDFGLSSDAIGDDVATGERMAGTPAYFAPERHAGAAPSESQDWYSVGVTLYQALTGRTPFEGTIAETLRLQREVDPRAPREVSADVPEDLNTICMALLHRDPERRFTVRDVRQMLARKEAPVADVSGPEPALDPIFVGRQAQLAALGQAWEAVKGGRATAVYVQGASGIGKSALIEHFLGEALKRERLLVLRGRCYEHESVPYKALDGVVDSLSQYLSALPRSAVKPLMPADGAAMCRLFPVMLRIRGMPRASVSDLSDPVVVRQRAFDALRELLNRLASQQPIVMYIDDVHWADADSALLLGELLRSPDAPPMLTLACARTEEIVFKPFLEKAITRSDAHVMLELSPMSGAESRELIASMAELGLPVTGEEIPQITREAQGNPFLLRQLARHASGRQAGHGPRQTFTEMLLERIDALAADAGPFLQMLAICGRPMTPALVLDAAGFEGNERALLRRLRSGHLVRSSGSAERVELYHDRIRETIVAALSAEERRRLHGLIARAMSARQIDEPEAMYEHFREAGEPGAASAHAAAAAAKADATLAFDRAAEFYLAALDLTPGSPSAPAWWEALAAALANAGRPVASAEAYLVAAQESEAIRRLELQRRAAEQFLVGGHIDRGLETIGAVLREVGLRLPSGPRRTLAALVWSRAALRWRGLGFTERNADDSPAIDLLRIDTCGSVASGLALVDTLRAAYFQTRYLLLALDAGEPARIVRGLAAEVGFSAIAGGRHERTARRLADRAGVMAAATGNSRGVAQIALSRGVSAFMVGRWRESTELVERALEMLLQQSSGAMGEIILAQNFLIGSLLYEGRIREVTNRTTRLLATALKNGNIYWDTELRTRQTLVWLAQDQPDEAIRQADEGISHWSEEGFHRQHYGHVLAHVQTELYRGRAERAWKLFETKRPSIKRALLLRMQWTRIEAAYVRARCALLMSTSGRDARACLAAAGQEVRRIDRERMPWSDPIARLLGAAIAFLDGDVAGAERRLIDSIDGFDRAGMRLYAAAARRRLGQIAGGGRGREQGGAGDEWMASEGIVNPSRMTRLIAPGFPDPA